MITVVPSMTMKCWNPSMTASGHGGGLVMQKDTPGSCSLGGCGCNSSALGGGAAAIFFSPSGCKLPRNRDSSSLHCTSPHSSPKRTPSPSRKICSGRLALFRGKNQEENHPSRGRKEQPITHFTRTLYRGKEESERNARWFLLLWSSLAN